MFIGHAPDLGASIFASMMGAMRKSSHTPEYSLLVKELKHLRTKAMLTQRDLAARLEVPHSWIAKVESAERRIDVIELCWFVRACDGDPRLVLAKIDRLINHTRGAGGQP
jgi:DNA-binding XRE family transcriptional regulator